MHSHTRLSRLYSDCICDHRIVCNVWHKALTYDARIGSYRSLVVLVTAALMYANNINTKILTRFYRIIR